MPDVEDEKDQKSDATKEERDLTSTESGGRQWNAWEGDPEYVKAHEAAEKLAKDPAAMKAAGGATGAPPHTEEDVADLMESAVEVDSQNRVRAVADDVRARNARRLESADTIAAREARPGLTQDTQSANPRTTTSRAPQRQEVKPDKTSR